MMALEDVELVEGYTDILQIGARNMQNFSLLKRVGRAEKPVMLKRGMSATVEEWLGCAEYILNEGNDDVILCERGIRTYETITRNTLDVSAVPVIKQLSDLSVVIDPSHGTGIRSLASRMAGSTFAIQYTLAQSVAGESPALIRDLLRENASLEPLLQTLTASLEELLEASDDERRFAALHAEVVEALSHDPSYSGADAWRQRAHRALTGA